MKNFSGAITRRELEVIPQQSSRFIKSNALTGLQFSGTTYPISATLQGKANVQINRASDGYVLFSAGNYTFSRQ